MAIHTLFEQRRADVERGWGSLNKEIALGFLVAHALGRTLSDDEAHEVGKRAGKLISTVKARIEKIKDRAEAKRSAARKAAGKDVALAATLVVRIADLDSEAAAARGELLEQRYDVGLPAEDAEMQQEQPSASRASSDELLAKAKAASIVADAAVEPADTERVAEMLRSDGSSCSYAKYKQLIALLDEREALQADLIAEAEAAERVRDLVLEKVVSLRTELLATQRAFEEVESAHDSADAAVRQLKGNECALSSAQKIARGLQEIVGGKQCKR